MCNLVVGWYMFKGPTLATFMIDQSSQQLITSFPFLGINSCVAFISTVQQDSFWPILIILILLLLSLFEGGGANFLPQSKRSRKTDIMSVENLCGLFFIQINLLSMTGVEYGRNLGF